MNTFDQATRPTLVRNNRVRDPANIASTRPPLFHSFSLFLSFFFNEAIRDRHRDNNRPWQRKARALDVFPLIYKGLDCFKSVTFIFSTDRELVFFFFRHRAFLLIDLLNLLYYVASA